MTKSEREALTVTLATMEMEDPSSELRQLVTLRTHGWAAYFNAPEDTRARAYASVQQTENAMQKYLRDMVDQHVAGTP